MSNILKKACLLILLAVPVLGFGVTPVPSSNWNGATGNTSGTTDPNSGYTWNIPISWNISLSGGVYTYVYSMPSFDSAGQSYQNFLGGFSNNIPAFFMSLDPSITAANFSTYVTNVSVTNGSYGGATVGNNAIPSPTGGNLYSALFKITNNTGPATNTTLTFKSTLAPIYGTIYANGSWADTGTFTTTGTYQTVATQIPVLGALAVPAPEPSTWLLLSGTLGLIVLLKYKQKNGLKQTI